MSKDEARRGLLKLIQRPRLVWLWALALLAPVWIAAASLAEPDVLLYPLPATIYESEITLTGIARPDQSILVEANGTELARTRSNASGDFAVRIHPAIGRNALRVLMPEARFATDSGVTQLRYVPTSASTNSGQTSEERSDARESNPVLAAEPPVLDALPAVALGNPIIVSGTAAANSEIQFFVNGRFTRSIVADITGAFSAWVPLEDAANAVYATATIGGETSAVSNTVETAYTNELARTHSGSISQHTVWTRGDGTPYTLSGTLTVAPGATLWIQPGAVVSVAGNYKVLVQGQLVVAGSPTARGAFKAASANCNGVNRRTDWAGIEVPAGGWAALDYAEVQCASAAVSFLGGAGHVFRSRIVNNSSGVRIEGTTSVVTPAIGNENEIRNNFIGVAIHRRSAPSIAGNNLFEANSNALAIYGGSGTSPDPTPFIQGNQILPTNTLGIFTDSFPLGSAALINARSNWWGTTNHGTIGGEIDDWHDASNLDSNDKPIVDFTGYLDGPNGSPFFLGATLMGKLSANASLGVGDTQILGSIIVNPGVELAMQPGSRLVAAAGSKILVRGSLTIAGTAIDRAVLRPTTAACNGVAQERSDWTGIEVAAGATATINYAEIHCATYAVRFNGGTGEVHHSRLLNNSRGVLTQALAASRITPSITTGNEFRGNTYGVVAFINSSPIISGNQFAENDYAVLAEGNDTAAQNALPIVTGNSFSGSRVHNLHAGNFGAARTVRIDATDNWWGTSNPTTISSTIYDWSDNPRSSPVVDYFGYLSEANGTAAWTGPTLNGPITASSSLPGVEHLMLGRVEVDAGVVVSIGAGARITPVADVPLLVLGTLDIVGTEDSRIVFRPLSAACTDNASRRGDWGGVLYQFGSSGSIEFADIHCASNGAYVTHAGNIRNSRFLGNITGIYVQGQSATALATPLIQGNEVRNNDSGIFVHIHGRPTVNGGNIITANYRGVQMEAGSVVAARPRPVVNGNGIYGNAIYNVVAQSYGANAGADLINARGNWWGTPDATQISPTIYDRKDSENAPHVDFSGYLGGMDGSAVFDGVSLIGVLPDDAFLPAGKYEVLGTVTVPAGKTLTVSAGADIRFVPGRALVINGTLSAAGTPTQRVVFGSSARVPAKGDWFGVQVLTGGTMHIEHARVENSTYGFFFDGGQGSIKESLCRFNTQGITVESKSSPQIASNNEITLNDYGVVVIGDQSGVANNPGPVVTGNNIYANATYNYFARGFSNPTTTTLNAAGNWWFETDPSGIRATIYTGASTSPSVDVGAPLAAATGPLAILLTGVASTQSLIEPLVAGSTGAGVFTISRAGSVKTQIRRDSDFALVYEYDQALSDSGRYDFVWDGRDADGAIVTPGIYRAIITASDGRDWMTVDFMAQAGLSFTGGAWTPPVYKPYQNEFFKSFITLEKSGLISMEIRPSGGTPFFAWRDIYYPAGSHWVYWDGRDAEGNMVDSTVEILTTDSTYIPLNAMQVVAARPVISGVKAAPDIEVKADPYFVTHSYEQITRMAYRVSDDSFVRFVLLPPGDTDIRGASAIVLLDEAFQSARETNGAPKNHVIEWRGYDPESPSRVRVVAEGPYTFAIEARSASTSQSTLYRGVVSLRQ